MATWCLLPIRGRVRPIGDGVLQQCYVAEEAGVVRFVVHWMGLIAYGANGLLWADQLASDDLRVGVDGETISGTGCFGVRADVPLTVDLATGQPSEPEWPS